MGANWRGLAEAVVQRRVELGYPTRKEFIEATGIGARTVGDIETARRESYDASTLVRMEAALQWEAGRVQAILNARDIADELMTASGVLGNLFVNRMDLTEEIHDPRLGPEARYRLIRMVRLDDVERDRQLREKVAKEKQRMIEAGEHET